MWKGEEEEGRGGGGRERKNDACGGGSGWELSQWHCSMTIQLVLSVKDAYFYQSHF